MKLGAILILKPAASWHVLSVGGNEPKRLMAEVIRWTISSNPSLFHKEPPDPTERGSIAVSTKHPTGPEMVALCEHTDVRRCTRVAPEEDVGIFDAPYVCRPHICQQQF